MKNITYLIFTTLFLMPLGYTFAESACPQTISFDDARKAADETHAKSFKPTKNPPKGQDPMDRLVSLLIGNCRC